jgi:hypothetical protein
MNCCGLVVASVVAPALAFAQEAAPAKLGPKLLLEDFRIARNSLEEGHSGIYRYTSKAELDREFDAAAGRIDHPITALEFYRLLAPVVARIKCGHTAVDPPRDLQRAISRSLPLFPLNVEVLSGKVYVFHDYSAEEHGLQGQEIRRIDGIPIESILATMLAATPGDGDSQTVRPWRVGHGGGFPHMLYSLVGLESPFHVEFRNPANGKSKELTLTGVIGPDRQKVASSRYPGRCS